MKRFVPIISFLLILSLFAAGCGKESESVTIEVGGTDAASAVASSSSGSLTVIGRVDSIVGNEVTLSIGTMDSGSMASSGTNGASGSDFAAGSRTSGRFGGASSSNMPGGATSGDFASGSNMPQGASGSDMRGGFGGATPGDLATGGNMPGGAAPSGTEGGSRGGALSITYTGETATYLLPVGMTIGTGDFSSVTEGMVLQLTIAGDGTITAVDILSR